MKLGLQMFSIRNAMTQDPVGAIRAAAGIGYKTIELINQDAANTAGVGVNLPAGELKALLDDLGVKLISTHLLPLMKDGLRATLDYCAELGNRYIAVSDICPNRDALLQRCEFYNEVGGICAEYGMMLLYHNHFEAFQRMDGEYAVDIMMANTDPSLVGSELDTYWAMRGGADPVAAMRSLGSRIKLLHQKDAPAGLSPVNVFDVIGADKELTWGDFMQVIKPGDFTEVGDGTMDVQSIVDEGNRLGIEYILIEQDVTTIDEIESVMRSYNNIKMLNGVEA